MGIIGIVAALTMPALIKNYQKNITISRLKKVYSVLSQAVLFSVRDNGEVENWNFDLDQQEFMDKYLSDYFKNIVRIEDPSIASYSKSYYLADGSMFMGWMFKNPRPEAYNVTTFYKIYVDINGNKKPNQNGHDKFIFYIFPKAQAVYNTGIGDCAINIPAGGLYPDGYGYSRDVLLNDSWRGCRRKNDGDNAGAEFGAFCTALIMLDGWNIDYKL
ncbi:MAG: DUF6613 domain-containing protein [Candidatus Gastranaerophilaceae bacterium]